ncbi:carbonic anhydrase [Thiorhodococcus mannitoliphagus]|uniref:Carbonic anhydrase n=2 Tax=Thiorhodococcus mannitoliphagus TaxID=329406 RepID=A0A6P1E180_9GAMM|nr:carbonic anhydrase [Thiorhodococcus mannitoliphagus]
MKKFAGLAAVLLLSGCAHTTKQAMHWGYSGNEGPERWSEISPEFAICSSGKNQSPIDLANFIKADLKPLAIDYQAAGNEILNNGHAIQINSAPGSKFSLDGHTYELKQYHFHAPSENLINGKSYPMEAHLVHADNDGNLAVIAVMFEEGKENQSIAQAWSKMPTQVGEKNALTPSVAAEGILPLKRRYYRFNGSLTTPPCSEGVLWLVMKDPVTVSKSQIEEFEHTMHHPNNRPVQAVNARAVMR